MSHDRIDFQRHVYLLVNALSTSFQKSGAVCVWVIFRSICGSYWKCHRYTSHYPRARMMMDESHAIKDNMAPFMFLIGSYKDFSLYICLDYPGRPLKAEIFSTCPINLNYLFVWTKFIFNYLKKRVTQPGLADSQNCSSSKNIYMYINAYWDVMYRRSP